MRTTEDRAQADVQLADTAPEFDRRLIRCRCRHSLDAHRQEVGTGAVFPFAQAMGCERCECDRFHARQMPWRICRDGIYALTVAMAGPWQVVSPRGRVVFRAWTQEEAAGVGCSMSGVDYLLRRVDRIERGDIRPIGNHPAGRALTRESVDPPPNLLDQVDDVLARADAGLMTKSEFIKAARERLGITLVNGGGL
ncbi:MULTISPECIES: hypothetical protein [unclassified Mycobacterium]|uniref:hypothetical protein n=1 Tax=unclassified Mycobacterium TaxID=2642494 RepID=UPI0029C8B66F|nr:MULTISPECIES: hypothetical protein [unclassified Mycobacterium]